jgi:hypothetical protein
VPNAYGTLTRVLQAALGRWPSRDILWPAAGWNAYGYVENNPVRWIDPNGTQGWLLPVGIAIAILLAWLLGRGCKQRVDQTAHCKSLALTFAYNCKNIGLTGSDYSTCVTQACRRCCEPSPSPDEAQYCALACEGEAGIGELYG